MNKFYTLLTAVLVVLSAVSCTTSPNSGLTTEPVDVSVSDNVRIDKVVGTWRGVIPCADCPGINYNLTLKSDNSFEETLIYQDRSAQPLTRTGAWKFNNGLLELDDPNEAYYKFSLTDGELLILDKKSGEPVNTEPSVMYRLTRDTGATDASLSQWNDSSKRGIDFVGNGYDPGWVLEIDLEKGMSFKTQPVETIVINTPVPAKPEVNGNSTTYRVTSESGEVVAELIKSPCTDAMSGIESPYTVKVTAKGKVYNGCGLFLTAPPKK